MKLLSHKYFLFTVCLGLFILSACCVPMDKNSFPQVIDTSYSDTAVKDADQFIGIDSTVDPYDSAFYPVYSINIQNTGSEADTFYLSYSRTRNGFLEPLTTQQNVNAGETKTFKTLGPIPSNAPDTLRVKYYAFFVKSPDSVHVSFLKPQITIHYGQTPNGPEQCGSPGKDISVDPTKLHK